MKFFKSLDDYAGLIHCYGVTQESNTQNYALVLPFMKNGSLPSFLNQNFNSLTWIQKLDTMQSISLGLSLIHIKDLTHKDLHLGNFLQDRYTGGISDFGFCKPADEISSNSNTYGYYHIWHLKYYVGKNIQRNQMCIYLVLL